MLELRMGRAAVPGFSFTELFRRPASSVDVDRHSFRDRRHPGAELLGVTQLVVAPKGAEERLLERVLGLLSTEPPDEQPIHAVAVHGIELLERREGHESHHVL